MSLCKTEPQHSGVKLQIMFVPLGWLCVNLALMLGRTPGVWLGMLAQPQAGHGKVGVFTIHQSVLTLPRGAIPTLRCTTWNPSLNAPADGFSRTVFIQIFFLADLGLSAGQGLVYHP